MQSCTQDDLSSSITAAYCRLHRNAIPTKEQMHDGAVLQGLKNGIFPVYDQKNFCLAESRQMEFPAGKLPSGVPVVMYCAVRTLRPVHRQHKADPAGRFRCSGTLHGCYVRMLSVLFHVLGRAINIHFNKINL